MYCNWKTNKPVTANNSISTREIMTLFISLLLQASRMVLANIPALCLVYVYDTLDYTGLTTAATTTRMPLISSSTTRVLVSSTTPFTTSFVVPGTASSCPQGSLLYLCLT